MCSSRIQRLAVTIGSSFYISTKDIDKFGEMRYNNKKGEIPYSQYDISAQKVKKALPIQPDNRRPNSIITYFPAFFKVSVIGFLTIPKIHVLMSFLQAFSAFLFRVLAEQKAKGSLIFAVSMIQAG